MSDQVDPSPRVPPLIDINQDTLEALHKAANALHRSSMLNLPLSPETLNVVMYALGTATGEIILLRRSIERIEARRDTR